MKKIGAVLVGLFLSHAVSAAETTVKVFTTINQTPIGTITFIDTSHGLLVKPLLSSLSPGLHGMHLHQHPSCDKEGMAAAGHFDPEKTGLHLGPFSSGHLGDLPALFVNKAGAAQHPVLAPRLTVKQLTGRTIMVHEGGDNYLDQPKPLGGGGARVACGVFEVMLETKPAASAPEKQ